MKRIVIIGGGAAGLMAAVAAANNGAEVMVLEKKKKPGRKLAISGKGRCNLTSMVKKEEFINNYPRNGRFLFSALHQFSNYDLIEFFAKQGLKTKVERGQRVFPVSDAAEDVVNVFVRYLKEHSVQIINNVEVKAIKRIENGSTMCVVTTAGDFEAEAVIIATGGMSYPGTGSTGDGYKWAQDLGHSIVTPRPSLVPLIAEEEWVKELQGLSLRNVAAKAYRSGGKIINEDFGEMLFTHFGVSGPIILSMSRDIVEYIYTQNKKVILQIDLKPALSEEKLDERLQRDLQEFARRKFKNSLAKLLPAKIIPVIIKLSTIDPERECHSITRPERLRLIELLKKFSLTIKAARPIAEAIVTSGGINIKEIDPRTMASKLVPNLYFAGEVIDVDGNTGGFNLQAAFSTGWIAGKNAAL